MKSEKKSGDFELLLAWADFITGLLLPGASSVVAGLRAIAQTAEKYPAWNPQLPPVPSRIAGIGDVQAEAYLRELELALIASPAPGLDRENLIELLAYRPLWRLYPQLHRHWLLRDERSGLPLAPFIELWSNTHADAQKLPVEFALHDSDNYMIPALSQGLGMQLDEVTNKKLKRDEPKLRITSFEVTPANRLRLSFSYCSYRDYLRTNWAIANLPAPHDNQLRRQLCGIDPLLPLNESKCANDLGVSAIVAFDDELILPKSSDEVIASPSMWVPTASGSADFMECYWLGEVPGGAQDILREAREELGIETRDFRKASVRLLSLTRNVLRGGKPEAFYYIRLPLPAKTELKTFEHEPGKLLRLPALLDASDLPVDQFEEKLKQVEAFMRRPSQPGDVVSPFTRVALYYYTTYAKARQKHTVSPR